MKRSVTNFEYLKSLTFEEFEDEWHKRRWCKKCRPRVDHDRYKNCDDCRHEWLQAEREEKVMANKAVIHGSYQRFRVEYKEIGGTPHLICQLWEIPAATQLDARPEVVKEYSIIYLSDTEEIQLSYNRHRFRISVLWDYHDDFKDGRMFRVRFDCDCDNIIRELISYVWGEAIDFEKGAIDKFRDTIFATKNKGGN